MSSSSSSGNVAVKVATAAVVIVSGAVWLARQWIQYELGRCRRQFPLPQQRQLHDGEEQLQPHRKLVSIDGEMFNCIWWPSSGDQLVVLVHGLGGQVAQWHELLYHVRRQPGCSVLAVDLLGHGGSSHSHNQGRYSLHRQAHDLTQLILQHRAAERVILVGHSMGAALVSLIYPRINHVVSHTILIAPSYHVGGYARKSTVFQWMPTMMIDILRIRDRRGGMHSASVNRVVARGASDYQRMQAMAVNCRSDTQTLKYIMAQTDYPTREHWQALQGAPCLIIGGEEDQVSPVDVHAQQLKRLIQGSVLHVVPGGHCPQVESPELVNHLVSDFMRVAGVKRDDADDGDDAGETMSSSGKWSLKNYEKWKATVPVSELIRGTNVRGMKVLRNEDAEHSPHQFSVRYPLVRMIVDISKEAPPYDTQLTFATYHKIGTTSKVPPSVEEVDRICDLITEFNAHSENASEIAVHCHYGFNRTGFILCAYLIRVRGYGVDEAMQAWREARPPGIRHEHFREELRRRYGTDSQ